MKKLMLLFFFAGLASVLAAQDPLLRTFNDTSLSDTVRLHAIDDLAWNYVYANLDSAILFANEELRFAERVPADKKVAWIARAYGTMASARMQKGDFPNALDLFLKVLKIREGQNDTIGIGRSYLNIGELYRVQRNFDLALENDLRAMKIFIEKNDSSGIGYANNNIGLIYLNNGQYEKSTGYFLYGLKIMHAIGDEREVASNYMYLADINQNRKKYSEALPYYREALKIKRKLGDLLGASICYLNIGEMNLVIPDYDKAILYCDSALQINKLTGNLNQLRATHDDLSKAFGGLGRYKEAYEHHVIYKKLTDSIFNDEASRHLSDLKTRYEVEKKEAELKTKEVEAAAIQAEEKKRKTLIIDAVVLVLVLTLLFSFFLFRRFKFTNAQKTTIENQKLQVDRAYDQLHEKNKEILDSINYARRIQRSQLPTESYIEKQLNRLRK
ncbi:MAG: tetratricopeptide repeat protein [Bacteroidia bacterium]